jgi:hypothetical protein
MLKYLFLSLNVAEGVWCGVQEPWDKVRTEMVEQKGLSAEAADLIGGYVVLRG